MNGDPRLPELDPSAEVLDLLATLLRAARHDPEFNRWLELRGAHADELDGIREAVAESEDRHQIRTAASAGHSATRTIETIAGQFPETPGLVLIAAVARGLDDLYGDYFRRPWLEEQLKKGPIQADDLIVIPGTEHLRALLGNDRSFAVPQTRATERPDQTRRCSLYEPPAAAPSIRFAADLEPHLDEVLSDAKLLATAHPTASSVDLELSFPVRATDEARHVDACVQLLERAFHERASVVVFPELAGYPTVTDELRQLTPSNPALVVAGSGQVALAGQRRNESLIWVARPSGNVPDGKPLSVRKMIPYEGHLGAEPLTDVGREITIQVDGCWRVAIGICRDLLSDDVLSALSQVGANLIAVPACSSKTSNFVANAAKLATNGPGFVVLANGPRFFHNAETGSVDDVPVAVFATPLDRVQDPTHTASCAPPQLCVYEIESNSVSAV